VLDAQGRLYGRGSADDGYAGFAALAAVRSLKAQGLKHGRILIMVECSEESGSPDLPHYMEACKQEIGAPGLVICLDSGCGNYEQLWSTTSLRGIVGATLKVEVLREGVHSGLAGGIVPNPMQVARLLLERLENAQTGELRPAALKVEIPPERVEQARRAARTLGGALSGEIPFVQGVRPLTEDPLRQLLESTWAPALAVIGQEGMPLPEQAGNVLLPALTLRLSLRTPPTLAPGKAAETLRSILEADPPFGAKVSVSAAGQSGWNAPAVAPWLAEATDAASREFYGKEACYAGIGGTIPFMAMLGERFPAAQFLITGVLGPNANAHGPNEFLHVPYAKRLTCCLVRVLAAHHAHAAGK
jgi:acetylornithine deacetylase/succinyl-diaminopimelate desuccinylase-like protein